MQQLELMDANLQAALSDSAQRVNNNKDALDQARAVRDALIIEASYRGMSSRRIGELVGISGVAVLNILKKGKSDN